MFFEYQHAYTKKHHHIQDIHHFMTECLVQTEPKYGIRTISNDTLYQGVDISGYKAIPLWKEFNGVISGYIIIGKNLTYQIGLDSGLIGVNLHRTTHPIFATDNLGLLALIDKMGYSASFGKSIEDVFIFLNSYAEPEKMRLIVSKSPVIDDLADIWVTVPSENKKPTISDLKPLIDERMKTAKKFEVKSELSVICMSEVQERPINWLWRDWLPLGKLTLLAGAGGCGKTNLTLSIVSTISTGGIFPDSSKCEHKGSVLIFSSEDDPEDVIKPRLIANGANQHKIYMITGKTNENGEKEPFNPINDIPLIIDYAKQLKDLKLILIDPITSFIAGDSNDNSKVRAVLEKLVDFALSCGCAILGITHFSKANNSKANNRILGAQAFTAVARMVWVATKKESENNGILAISKTNIARDDKGIKYELEQIELGNGIITTKIKWLETVTGNASELLAEYDEPKEFDNTLDEVSYFLQALLTDNEKLTAKEVFKLAKEQGYSERTVRRAKDNLQIKPYSSGFGNDKKWYWSLPIHHRLDEPTTF